jgi:hypothetical protein
MQVTIKFLKDCDEYSEGQVVSLARNVARRYIREGVALVNKKVKERAVKKTKKIERAVE